MLGVARNFDWDDQKHEYLALPINPKNIHKVTSCCDNGPRVPLGYASVLQYTLLFCVVFYSKGRVLKLYTVSSFDLSVVSFSWQSCCSSKSFRHFWNTRAL